jgi:hypothetical protein
LAANRYGVKSAAVNVKSGGISSLASSNGIRGGVVAARRRIALVERRDKRSRLKHRRRRENKRRNGMVRLGVAAAL